LLYKKREEINMPIAEKMIKMVEGMAMVKKMFEEGARLKAEHGPGQTRDIPTYARP
jgi:hypothetical protein